jgi:hypothetical protein
VTSFQWLRDYEGLEAHLHDYKIEMANSLMDLMDAVSAELLVVASSTSPYAKGDMDKIAGDLRTLAGIAAQRGISIAFGAPAWARWINEYPAVWEAVRRADCEHVARAARHDPRREDLSGSARRLSRRPARHHRDGRPSPRVSERECPSRNHRGADPQDPPRRLSRRLRVRSVQRRVSASRPRIDPGAGTQGGGVVGRATEDR